MEDIFDIEKFNIISDSENYYFLRALNMGDNQDIETGITSDNEGNIERVRTDRQRYIEKQENREAKYSESSPISLEQVYDHIKMLYRKDTNCISLSSNANVSITYGRGSYTDKYILVKVPKKELGTKVINAGQYMLREIEKRVNEYLSKIEPDENLLETIKEIETSTNSEELKEVIQKRYNSKEKLDPEKAKMQNKGIKYKTPSVRISSSQALNEEQSLEKNKIVAKLTLLERTQGMEPLMQNTSTNNLIIKTIGSAFSSLELIHYGEIEKEEIINIPKEIVDIFALIQQVEDGDKELITELKQEVIKYIGENSKIEIPQNSTLEKEYKLKDNISIEEMYELTEGKVEYGQANSIVKNMYYLAKGQANAKDLAEILRNITKNNPKYNNIIEQIANNGFRIEPEIIARKSNKGVRLSESVNISLKSEEKELVDKIRGLSQEEQIEIIENGGLSNIKNIMNDTFAKARANDTIDKNRYYAEAIISLYDWEKIGIEEFTVEERNNLIKRIQEEHCIELYNKLQEERNRAKQNSNNIIKYNNTK